MANNLAFITWNADPEMFVIPGIHWPVRWYGLMFALAFVASQMVMAIVYKKEGRPQKHLDILTLYIILGTVLGARLGHCLFYEPEIYLKDPIRILKIYEGGLASHGGAIGIILAMWLYCRKTKENWRWIFDRLVIVVALSGMCIRLGNLMNSEIIGKPTSSAIGFVFVNPFLSELKEVRDEIKTTELTSTGRDTVIDGTYCKEYKLLVSTYQEPGLNYSQGIWDACNTIAANHLDERHIIVSKEQAVSLGQNKFQLKLYGIPRHAAQLYEAVFCLFLFLFLCYLWVKKKYKLPQGFIFGLFCTLLFSFRFIDEMLKENQVAFENSLAINMGQILSIPFILIGIGFILWSKKSKRFHEEKLNTPLESLNNE